jgi:uncharacterized membrane protein YesL
LKSWKKELQLFKGIVLTPLILFLGVRFFYNFTKKHHIEKTNRMIIVLLIYVISCGMLSYFETSIKKYIKVSYKNLFLLLEIDSSNFGFNTGLLYVNNAGNDDMEISNQHIFTLSFFMVHLKLFIVEKYR